VLGPSSTASGQCSKASFARRQPCIRSTGIGGRAPLPDRYSEELFVGVQVAVL
jgi:hypothetical protein